MSVPTEPAYVYRATCVRVVDGDTFIANVDLGFRIHAEFAVRLYDVDAPEAREAGGSAAALYLHELIDGRPLLLRSYRDQQSFARWVCEVFAGGGSVADALVEAGHATRER